VGTKLKEFGGKNFRKGKGGYLVLEADEWKAAFHHYSPFVATITNIDAEHLDFYKNFDGVKKSFEKFKSRCHAVVERPRSPEVVNKVRKVLKVSGEHNVQNALNAYAVASFLGIPEKIILSALGKYHGAWRRMEFRGYFKSSLLAKPYTLKPALVFDDYGHHPSEIKATLAGLRQKYAKNALICVFQPHQAQRLKLLFSAFKTCFRGANRVVILPTYEVAGRERGFEQKYSSEALAKAIGAIYIRHPEMELKTTLTRIVSSLLAKPHTLNPIIVMMGAGTISDLTPKILK
ncbi:MAG: cyanophycin synthetase, partial [Patescibacteria group bacterium]